MQPEPWRAETTRVTIDLSASYANAIREALPDAGHDKTRISDALLDTLDYAA